MAEKKTVYLATPKGPVSYFLEGAWLSPANGSSPVSKKRKRRTKAEMEASKEPTFKDDKKPAAAKKSSSKKSGSQATI